VKAAYYQARRHLEVRDAPDPEPGPNEVLVRVRACGICRTDQHIYDGDFFPSYPLIGGHEIAGEVVALGS
jgi:D-arabinitol dehydrogenase (NADP+)